MNARLCLALAAAAALTAVSAPATAAETIIYLQRAANGRAILTDRPQPLAVTERSWQVEREDPAAARQRASEVQRQADAVSARIARSMEAQQLRAELADRDRGGSYERDSDRSRDDGVYGGGWFGGGYGAGYGDSSSGSRRDGRGFGRYGAYPPPGDSGRNEYIGPRPQFQRPRLDVDGRRGSGGRLGLSQSGRHSSGTGPGRRGRG